jgi:DNA-binding PadR family transcriptional regulator
MAKQLPNSREAILLAILVEGEKYGREIRDAYEKRARRDMPLGSLYTTLDRMEDAGFVVSRVGDPNPQRGGNRRKFYKITGNGIRSLNELQRMVQLPKVQVAHA